MEILQLKYFYALSQSEHVSKTAEQLHIAQPALTQSIRRLEKELGVKLFKSNGRNITLTESGIYLSKKIEPVLKALSEIPEELSLLNETRRKLIKINVLAASNVITNAIIEYKKEHTDINFVLVQNYQEEDADITISTKEFFQIPKQNPETYYVFTEKIFLAVPGTSKLSSEESVILSNIASIPFVSLAGSKSLRIICDRFCMHAGFKPNVVFESDSPEAVKNLISVGVGVGFWPEYTWGMLDTDSMKTISIAEPLCQRDIIVNISPESNQTPEINEFFEFLKTHFNSLKH